MIERRSGQRLRTVLSACVRLDDAITVHECAVRDLSDTGAQIILKQPVQIPDEIDFEIPRKSMAVRARVIWSDGVRHGLTFIGVSRSLENVARALYDAADEGHSWDSEPEIIKDEFRTLASSAITALQKQKAEAAAAA